MAEISVSSFIDSLDILEGYDEEKAKKIFEAEEKAETQEKKKGFFARLFSKK